MQKPLLIFDGECHFCRRWIARWKEATRDRVDYLPSQEAAQRFPEIPPEEFTRAVQWVEPHGRREAGAAAILCALATTSPVMRQVLAFYRRFSFFAHFAEGVYMAVSRHRSLLSSLTRLLWGDDVRHPTFARATRIFLHLLGGIYLVAFVSYWRQLAGLNGSEGLLPASGFFTQAREYLGPAAYWQFPSLCWLNASDPALNSFCAIGTLAALLLMLGIAAPVSLIILWISYLSLTIAGQVFYQFQWDILLLETGFLAIFVAPWSWRLKNTNPLRLGHFLLLWLLFRLMFASGIVKLSSGDPAWAAGIALDFHYFTQPLPTPLAWYVQQLPPWWQWLSVKAMFAIELGLPFFLFGPRRMRLAGAAGLAALQAGIALTGNYGIFNLLTMALCLLAIDDRQWPRWTPLENPALAGRFLPKSGLALIATPIIFLSMVPLCRSFRKPMPWLAPLAEAYEYIAPFRTINGYGLFAVMTTERREIIIQGSDDGIRWKTYEFRYKPGPLKRPPPMIAPYMPRLDWQMWFAALGSLEGNPWLQSLLLHLLTGSRPVLDLLENNPFPDKPPRHVRALTDNYTFTTAHERAINGAWWKADPQAIYCPAVSLPQR